MSRKALLIGAQAYGLSGVDFDVASLAEALARRGFHVERCEGQAATRDHILASIEQLIAGASEQDAVVLYFSGHGGYLPRAENTAGKGATDLRFIVPTDYHESTVDDFRGITSLELSSLVGRLATCTSNVVIALDCCHVAHMSRDADLLPRALPRADGRALPSLGTSLSAHVVRPLPEHAGWDPLGNRGALWLLASAPWQSAFEYTNTEGQRAGVFTESLVQALREFEVLPVGWSTLMERVRSRVAALVPTQRPEAEGATERRLFETIRADMLDVLPVAPVAGGRVRLDNAPFLGVQPGDQFLIMPPGEDFPASPPTSAEAGIATAVATATIDEIGAEAAFAPVSLQPGWPEIPVGARAHMTKAVVPSLPVRADPRDVDLVTAIEANPLLRIAADGEAAALEVRVDAEGRRTVHDHAGPLHDPRLAGRVAEVIGDLYRVARATALRTLPSNGTFQQPITVEWGRVAADGAETLPPSGAVLHVGERVFVRVRNDGDRTVYASLIDVGIAADITSLTSFDPSGVPLAPGQEYVFGEDPYSGALVGVTLYWPAHFDEAHARQETIVVLVTSAPQDLTGVNQVGVRGAAPFASPLDRLVAQARMASRDLTVTEQETMRTIRTVTFDLIPNQPLPHEDATFQIDERPPAELRLLSRSPRDARPTTVAVRLDELVIHRARSRIGADIRLDVLVITGHDAAHVTYRARTERFGRIHDGERLPLDRLLMYYGPAVDFLDLAIWISRDAAGSQTLGDRLQEVTSGKVQGVDMRLMSLAAGSPGASVAMAAAGACLVLGNTAHQMLTATASPSVGLYRTTLLAAEEFGAGRHPSTGLLLAQDFSLAYSVTLIESATHGGTAHISPDGAAHTVTERHIMEDSSQSHAGHAAGTSIRVSAPPIQGDGNKSGVPSYAVSVGDTERTRPLAPLRLLVAQAPAQLPQGAPMSLVVRIVSEESPMHLGSVSASMPRLVPEQAGTAVKVTVSGSPGLQAQGPLEALVHVHPTGDPDPLLFSFLGTRSGLHQIVVIAWAGGTFLGELKVEVTVSEDAAYSNAPTRVTPLGDVVSRPGEATMEVRFNGSNYVFQLHSYGTLFDPVEFVAKSPGVAVNEALRKLQRLAATGGDYSQATTRRLIKAIGVDLWKEMVPPVVRDQFWEIRKDIGVFTIATNHDDIPWEIVYPLDPHNDEGFLVEQIPVLRRSYGQRRSRTVGVRDARFIVSKRRPAGAEAEVAAIRRIIGGDSGMITSVDALLEHMSSEQIGALHFACHNSFNPTGSSIDLEGGPFIPDLLAEAEATRQMAAASPLVFINACRSAGATPSFTQIMGWAQRFMAAGAGAFVGTLWDVRTESSASFATIFYEQLISGKSLGEATLAARTAQGKDAMDPTWLAYTVYGDPFATAVS